MTHTKRCLDFVENTLTATVYNIECICHKSKKQIMRDIIKHG